MWELWTRSHRVVAALAIATLSASVVTSARAQESVEDAEPPPAILEVHDRADEVVAAYLATYARLAELQDTLAAIRAEIPLLERRVDTLHAKIQRRAAELYKDGSSTGGLAIFDVDPETAARRADLGRAMAKGDSADVAALRATKERLERRVAELQEAEAEQEDLLELLDAQYEAIQNELLELTEGLDTQARRCPIQGPVLFTNDWGRPRPGDRTHQGTDIFSPPGAPNVAVVAGTIRQGLEELGGLVVYLDGDDGHTYYYAHLSGFEEPPRRVEAGEVIGYTGDTGNAIGGAPHTHFEIHEDGSRKINPYPIVRGLCRGDATGR